MSRQASETGRMDHLPALDGVRGLAILLVMVFHFGQVLSRDVAGIVEPCLARLAAYGRLGVDLFFVLSGFLITGILLATKGSRTYFSAFYMRRALRIVPLYFAFLVYIFLIYRIFYYYKLGVDPIPGPDALWF